MNLENLVNSLFRATSNGSDETDEPPPRKNRLYLGLQDDISNVPIEDRVPLTIVVPKQIGDDQLKYTQFQKDYPNTSFFIFRGEGNSHLYEEVKRLLKPQRKRSPHLRDVICVFQLAEEVKNFNEYLLNEKIDLDLINLQTS